MENETKSASSLDVLIFAPTGQDATLLATALESGEVPSLIFKEVVPLCLTLNRGAGALLIAEEALSLDTVSQLNKVIKSQEAWSELPIVIMVMGGQTTFATARLSKVFAPSGNISLLERPFRPLTLVSSLQVALRSRKRQYQMRDLLTAQKSAMLAREEFILVASHELKTPLTSLKLQLQMGMRFMREKPPGLDRAEKMNKIVATSFSQVDKLTRLVEDMIDVTRMNSGKLDVQKSEFDLSQLLEELVRNIMPVLNSAGCTVHMDIVDSLIGNWDRFRIEQVVSNLLNNAIKYSSGSPLWISLKKLRGRAILTVRDGGKGIAPENHEKIFQRFERATSNEDIRGLGLGLYICREIVESHQGTIRVESELGKGASFIIDLPLFSSDQGSKIDLQPQIAVKL